MSHIRVVENEFKTPEEAVESALACCWADHEENPCKGAVIITIQQDGSYFYTYSHNLSDAQVLSMASFVQTIEAMSFLGEYDSD